MDGWIVGCINAFAVGNTVRTVVIESELTPSVQSELRTW